MEKVSFYFDEMVSGRVANQLRVRGIRVVMATEAGMDGQEDIARHLAYARQHQLVTVTFDHPFAGRVMQRTDHPGLICWTGEQDDFGGLVRALVTFVEQHTPESATGQVFWLR
jgi:predicted nuclease of predicted toxin-antitoxin system